MVDQSSPRIRRTTLHAAPTTRYVATCTPQVVDATWYMPGSGKDPLADFATQRIPGAVFFDVVRNFVCIVARPSL